jgi:hypothetical protein
MYTMHRGNAGQDNTGQDKTGQDKSMRSLDSDNFFLRLLREQGEQKLRRDLLHQRCRWGGVVGASTAVWPPVAAEPPRAAAVGLFQSKQPHATIAHSVIKIETIPQAAALRRTLQVCTPTRSDSIGSDRRRFVGSELRDGEISPVPTR